MKLCFLGAYDPEYPRNIVIKKGLRRNSIEFSECGLLPRYKFFLRYPILLSRYLFPYSKHDFFFVPEFCQKDVPLARFLSLLTSKRVIFDPLASRFETKIIDWERKPLDSWQARWNLKIDNWAFKLSDLVLADTQAHKDYYCRMYGLPQEKVAVLPVGFDDDIFKPSVVRLPHYVRNDNSQVVRLPRHYVPRNDIQVVPDKEERFKNIQVVPDKEERFTVLFYGSFLPLHGVDVILQAAKKVYKKEPSIQFKIIGSGQTLPKVKSLAGELGLSNVHFEDWLPQDKLPERITLSDICLGIFGETEKARRVVPHKIFQSMGMRKPVITTRTPAVEEVFSHKENIFLISEPKPDLLSQAILELKRDKVLRDKIAENGYELVRQKYSPEAIGRTFADIIKRYFFTLKEKKDL
ncbi:MAG: glycosyltransferase [Candidatus Aminicenantes bacterium]|nr:glycosyltransferase [Candidatus Aminicenantes bacterium]